MSGRESNKKLAVHQTHSVFIQRVAQVLRRPHCGGCENSDERQLWFHSQDRHTMLVGPLCGI